MRYDLDNQIDVNDFQYVLERFGTPVSFKPCPQDKLTGKINPHVSQFEILGMHNQVVSVFHVKPIYYEHVSGAWRPMYEVMEYYGNHLYIIKHEKLDDIHPEFMRWLIHRQKLLRNAQVLITNPYQKEKYHIFTDELGVRNAATVSFTVTTTYPDPNPETTTVDGLLYRNGPGGTFASHRGATSATATLPSEPTQWGAVLGSSASAWYYYYRAMFLFDTSSIPDTDNITDGTISFSVNSKTNSGNAMSLSVGVIACNPASNTDLVVGDFDNVTYTRQATDLTWASVPATGYGDWTLNATGLSNISKTGVSKFAQLLASDIDNSEPTLNSTNSLTGFDMDYADQTGTSSDPKLAITHSSSVVTYRGMFALIEKA